MPFELIPEELKSYNNWVCWKYAESDSGKPTKVPVSARTGQAASTVNPADWASFNEATAAAANFNGLGFVFTDTPYAGIDLDAASDPATVAKHQAIEAAMSSYSELSPSGRGLHIIVRGSVPHGKKDKAQAIEVYSDARYFTMTGQAYRQATIREAPELNILWEELQGAANPMQFDFESQAQIAGDEEIIARAAKAENGAKFRALWAGEGVTDHSAADQALINILAFYTQNFDQIARLFHRSMLGKRKKATRNDYLQRTIAKAMDKQIPTIDFSNLKRLELPAPEEPIPDPPAFSVTLPPGLLGDIARFVFASAPRPVPEIALGAAIGLLAGVCGRAYNVSGTGLNQYVLCLARTGSGKEAAASGIDKIMQQLKMSVPAALEFLGPAEIASGPALIKYLSNSGSFVSVVGEFGLTLQAMHAPHANSGLKSLKKLLLDLYNKSGHGQQLRPLIYSDKEKNTPTIDSPAFSILGESTPETFYRHLDDAMISDGLLPRFTVLEYTGGRPALNTAHTTTTPPDSILQMLAEICVTAVQMKQRGLAIDVALDADAEDLSRQFDQFCDKRINDSEVEVGRQLWNRAHIKTLKLAALVAVGINPIQPVISGPCFTWAATLIQADCVRFENKVQVGEIGAESNEVKQLEELRKCLEYYCNLAKKLPESYRVSDKLREGRIVPQRYLSRLENKTAFSKDRIGSGGSLQRTIRKLLDMGELQEVKVNDPDIKDARGKCYLVR
jgi:hypothetical protein